MLKVWAKGLNPALITLITTTGGGWRGARAFRVSLVLRAYSHTHTHTVVTVSGIGSLISRCLPTVLEAIL